jgi:hypothetical protein
VRAAPAIESTTGEIGSSRRFNFSPAKKARAARTNRASRALALTRLAEPRWSQKMDWLTAFRSQRNSSIRYRV